MATTSERAREQFELAFPNAKGENPRPLPGKEGYAVWLFGTKVLVYQSKVFGTISTPEGEVAPS